MKKGIDNIKNNYELTIPYFNSATTKNFSFNTKIGEDSFIVYFKWSSSQEKWRGWIKINEEKIRLINTIPNVLSWSRYEDYSIYLEFDGETIGLSDLVNVKIIIIQWK